MKELVTAALPYANGDLHLGHLMSTYLPADAYSRYCRLRSRETLFVCATDEHGAPIQIKAEQAKTKPEDFVKKYRDRHARDFAKFDVSFDSFHHTHSPEDEKATLEFYGAIKAKGLFYEKTIDQTHCPKCDRSLPDRYLKGTCPFCGAAEQYGDGCEKCGKTYQVRDLADAKCALCGTKPETRPSNHLFFKLSSFKDFFTEWFATAELQKDVVNYVRNWVDALEDWDITRDGPYFGIPIPDRPNQYFYVWFDAPIGYVASTAAWCNANGGSADDWWKGGARITHFIGKDIVYHHYLFWPAMLNAAGYALPTRIPTRGHLQAEGEKMSKSRGNFILLHDLDCDSDFVRYYLTCITPNAASDINFSKSELREKANKELVDSYGNLVNRSLSFIKNKMPGGRVPEKGASTPEDEAFEKETDALLGEVAAEYDAVELKRALEKAMAFSGRANKYFNDREPWKLLKENPAQAQTVLHNTAKAIFVLSAALSPIIPKATAKTAEMLGCRLAWDASAFKPGELSEVKALFAKIE
ncbi:methionine--tRNA ligase [Candidatus Micrarchaeota archaeon CG_4_10_14_0_2_um_filter_60_11]|nr:MAG: methionine--tRNA ligase [Candidatus Micrarchaeota archaeon CG1_02_60_51]PIN95978.1 MAG: methionine--tRNA ligase [Candidatus Micrarchaeota archaeon CG10_big_fil_rev_8_21_14_0_10_60_32]PIO02168.1 MAG: methionine--tRNA ligase [Candidatus Micrarchaeota archaeon CG09_land_8_20_14_0_10_60_16]PIY91454.1 MAG: methionine--tRNA ligase [Candidatus Micrarchaeota archaeon CG_4_10_14_0_8_um_filter_60_7]PIZ91217.1 MAG: methionine--tRNA ligase [Candidatus Micrarchaeota archaeon CG_4_10_14_0_2_um_filter